VGLRDLVGALQLAQDFRLTHDHRLESGGDGIKMLHARHAAQLKRKRRKILAHRVELAQEIGPRGGGPVGLGRGAEVFDPVAGGDEDRLA